MQCRLSTEELLARAAAAREMASREPSYPSIVGSPKAFQLNSLMFETQTTLAEVYEELAGWRDAARAATRTTHKGAP
jgi:hypothetical protein